MQITSENGFKNALIYQKLWPKQVTDKNYGHFLCILSLFLVENMVSRGSTSHVSSEKIFMFWRLNAKMTKLGLSCAKTNIV